MKLLRRLLKPAGRVVLHEFHPFMRKCHPEEQDGRLWIQGNYFSDQIEERKAPFSGVFTPDETAQFPLCRYRFCTIGETVTAICVARLPS